MKFKWFFNNLASSEQITFDVSMTMREKPFRAQSSHSQYENHFSLLLSNETSVV